MGLADEGFLQGEIHISIFKASVKKWALHGVVTIAKKSATIKNVYQFTVLQV